MVDINKMLITTGEPPMAVRIVPLTAQQWQDTQDDRDTFDNGFAQSNGFSARPGQVLVVPATHVGTPKIVYVGVDDPDDMWALATAAAKLPAGEYRLDDSHIKLDEQQAYKMTVGWALAQYRFGLGQNGADSAPAAAAKLAVPQQVMPQLRELESEIKATWKVRDLINTPANLLNTGELAKEVYSLGDEFNAVASMTSGKAPMFEINYPLIHAVGKASENLPHFVTVEWSGSAADENAPTVMLVGKGVTFDTGGLDLKPAASMLGMKKDMGGAAHALGLARMVMENDLPVHLKLAVPIAENSVSSNAFRPSDIITARDGTTVEIGNTDAEGRLILADALSYGSETWKPDVIIDFATLTGAQRVADGHEVGGVWSNDKEAGRAMEDIGERWSDDLQLHHIFKKFGPLPKTPSGADLSSTGSGIPGATYAAMFLQHFTRAAQDALWFHFDISGANPSSKPGRPAGGEALGLRASYRFLKMGLGL